MTRRIEEGPAVTVRRAVRLAPDTYARVRAVCVFAADGIDLDEYAAQVTLTVCARKLGHAA